MANIIIANGGAAEQNIPIIGSRFLNIYTGAREKPDFFEKLGQVYIYCLSKAIGKQIKLIEGTPCEVKTAKTAQRIFFGAAAILTLPFTFAGILLNARSKTQKSAHDVAINSLKIEKAPKKEDKPVEKPKSPVKKPPTVEKAKENKIEEEKIPEKNNLPKPVKRAKAPRPKIVFEWAKKKEDEIKEKEPLQEPKDNPNSDKKEPDPEKKPEKKTGDNQNVDKKKEEIPEELSPVVDQIENILVNFENKLKEKKVNLDRLAAKKLADILDTQDLKKQREAAKLATEKMEAIYTNNLNRLNEDTNKLIASTNNQHKQRINKHKDKYDELFKSLKDKQQEIFEKIGIEWSIHVNDTYLNICRELLKQGEVKNDEKNVKEKHEEPKVAKNLQETVTDAFSAFVNIFQNEVNKQNASKKDDDPTKEKDVPKQTKPEDVKDHKEEKVPPKDEKGTTTTAEPTKNASEQKPEEVKKQNEEKEKTPPKDEKKPPEDKKPPVGSPKEIKFPNITNANEVNAFSIEHKQELLIRNLKSGRILNSARADILIKLIDELEQNGKPLFTEHRYDENDALSLAIKNDSTLDLRILKRIVKYIGDLPQKEGICNPKNNWAQYKSLNPKVKEILNPKKK